MTSPPIALLADDAVATAERLLDAVQALRVLAALPPSHERDMAALGVAIVASQTAIDLGFDLSRVTDRFGEKRPA